MKPLSASSNSQQIAQGNQSAQLAVSSQSSSNAAALRPQGLHASARHIVEFVPLWMVLAALAGWFAYGCGGASNGAQCGGGKITGPLTVAVGAKVQLILDDSCGDVLSGVTWIASPGGYLSVDSNGYVTGLSATPTTPTAVTVAVTGSSPEAGTKFVNTATVQMTVTGPTLMTIAVTDANNPPGTAVVGTTDQFTATGTYSDNTTQNLTTFATWSSGTPADATIVSTTGLASAVAVGSPVITASLTIGSAAPITGQETLNVTAGAPTLTSIAVTPAAPSVAAGLTQQFTATGTYSSGPNQVLTTGVTWASLPTSTATISTTGLATGVAAGSATITATVGALSSPGITLTVTAPVLQSITVTPSTAAIQVGQTQAYTLTGNYSDGSHLPITTGITWKSAPTSIATINSSGVATGVATGTATITASASSLNSNSVTLTVNAVQGNVPRYLFEVNDDNTISDYAVIPSTGQLRSFSYVSIPAQSVQGAALNSASPVPVIYLAQLDTTTGVTQISTVELLSSGLMILVGGGTPANLSGALAVDPQGRYLYATDNTDQQISLFTLDPISGLPTAGPGLPITVAATELAIDPAGAFLYMEDNTGSIHSYQIGAGGALTAVGTPPSSHPLFGRQPMVVDPSGSFLLAIDAGSQNFLYEYSISAGALTPVAGSPFLIGGFGGNISKLVFDPAASFLYAIDDANDQLLGFTFSGNGLTPLTGSPFAVPAVGVPENISVDPSGKFVFVAYAFADELWTYRVASGGSAPGALTPVNKMRLHSSVQFAQLLSSGTAAVTFTPKQLLVANEETPGATITQFTIDPATGSLSPLSTPIGAGDTAKTVATDPFGANAYAPAFTSDAVFGYNDIFGVGLSFYATEPYAAGNGPSWLTTDLSGSFLYVTMQTDNTVWKYDLPLQPASGAVAISTHAGPVFVTTDPTGSFLYVADGTAATIDVFGINLPDGGLGPVAGGSVTQGLSQNWIAIDPSGRFAYSADPQFNAVWEFTIGTTGALSLNSTSHVSLGPVSSTPGASSVVVEPTGKFLYATNEIMSQIYAFTIDPSTGLLTQVSTGMSNGQVANTDPSPTGLAVDISGKFLYCVNAGATAQTASIDIFAIDLTTGLLTPVGTINNVPFAAGFTTTGILQ